MEYAYGKMGANMMANGLTLQCMAMVYIPGTMDVNMKEILYQIKDRVKAYKHGQMGAYMMVNGAKVNNMV